MRWGGTPFLDRTRGAPPRPILLCTLRQTSDLTHEVPVRARRRRLEGADVGHI